MSQRQGQMNQTEKTNMSVQGLHTSNLINHSYQERKKSQKKRIENLQEIAKNLIKTNQKPKPEGLESTRQKIYSRGDSTGKSERMLGTWQKTPNSGLKIR